LTPSVGKIIELRQQARVEVDGKAVFHSWGIRVQVHRRDRARPSAMPPFAGSS
jgi:hypothetical protein